MCEQGCSCIYVDVQETFTTLSEAVITARKSHRCDECGATIETGAQYERYVGVYEGKMHLQHTCLDCVSIRAVFFCDG
jgi:hypothetical protein